MVDISVPVHKITVPITSDELTLNVSGDQHLGVQHVTREGIIEAAHEQSDKHKGNLFRVFTGDLTENALKTSIGHNYDLKLADPAIQKEQMKEILHEIMERHYGPSVFKKLKIPTSKNTTGCMAVGCCGNHEYRTRKQSGQWIDKEMYDAGKILSLGMHGIIELTVLNKKLKMSKVYRIFVSHRPTGGTGTSLATLMRGMLKKRADVPGCDLYIYGHFHKRVIMPDGHYDSTTGKFKKLLYVVNPSPLHDMEYADVAGYSPLVTGYHVNVFLPLEENKFPYGTV